MEAATADLLQAAHQQLSLLTRPMVQIARLATAASMMTSGESSLLRESTTSSLARNGSIWRTSAIPRENNLAPQPMGGSIVALLSQDR
jgi:hypothetical protein